MVDLSSIALGNVSTGAAVGIYVALLGVFFGISSYMERAAAMRGSHRKPLNAGIDKGLRLFFLIVLTYPLLLLAPYATATVLMLYIPLYLDGSEKSGLRASERVANSSIFKLVKWYFAMELVTPYGALDPKRQYVIGVHPHGFLPLGTLINMLSNVNGEVRRAWLNGVKLRTLAASFCFYIPGYRDFILSGGVIDAARYNAKRALKAGFSITLVPGGATEALYAGPGHNTLVLKNRKGFVKLALECGADLVPVYSFGENDCYEQLATVFPVFKKIQSKFQRVFGISLPMVTSILPRRAKIVTVIGKPIPVTKCEDPTDAQVAELLLVYQKALEALFYAHCDTYIADAKHRKLEVL